METLLGLVNKEFAKFAAVAVLVIVAVRVAVFVHLQPSTALAVLGLQGWSILPQIFLASFPVALSLGFYFCGTQIGDGIRYQKPVSSAVVITILWSLVALAFGSWPVWYAAAVAVALDVIYGLVRRGKHEYIPPWVVAGRPVTEQLTMAIMLVGLAAAMSVWTPWLPLERIQAKSRPDQVGYVVGQQGPFTAVVSNSDRRLTWLPTSAIGTRTPCRTADSEWSESLAAKHVWPNARPPVC